MLRLEQVSKRFCLPYGTVINAVKDITLTLSRGDFAVVVGLNGAGKSTLFDLISGHLYVDAGQIYFNNANITFYPPHKRAKIITLISQMRGAGLPRAMTVKEVVQLAVETRNRARHSYQSVDICEKLEALEPGLSRIANSQIWHLSGGEYQLVALLIASILCEQSVGSPHILLFDEHISQLAPSARERVLRVTKELVNQHNLTAMMQQS